MTTPTTFAVSLYHLLTMQPLKKKEKPRTLLMKEYAVTSPQASLREVPDAAAPRGKLESQLVTGELFFAEEEAGGWCRGWSVHDGYKGWVEKKYLSPDIHSATHVVTAVRTHAYRDASMKSPVTLDLSFGSRLAIADTSGDFSKTGAGWIFAKHLAPADTKEPDYAANAMKFLETPYLWGGRGGFGIDCSGLVQVCLARAGIKAERDSGPQSETLGRAVDTPQKGDFVFFPGHVGIMLDDKTLINADAHHMKVVAEPLEAITARRGAVTAVRRI